jgi:molybdopterin-containing oxidoreductase family iron-sulfur binding subunit
MKPDSTDSAAPEAPQLLQLGLPFQRSEGAFTAVPGAAGDEFPEGAAEFTDEPSRRRFLALMGASLALAGTVGCNLRPAAQRKIIPYTNQPDEITPGVPLYFASAAPLAGYGQGVLVRSNEGRPTKIEGNPDHPASLGGAGLFALASVLDLYDPDRSRVVTHLGTPTSYEQALAALRGKLYPGTTPITSGTAPNTGVRLRVVTETVTSPTLAAQITQLLKLFPSAKWVRFDAVSTESVRAGTAKAFGKPLTATYDFLKADVVVSLDADFLCTGPGHVRYSRDFADRRKIRDDGKNAAELAAGRKPGFKEGVKFDPAADLKDSLVNRLYAVETMPTNTGAVADHRLALTNAQVLAFARALAAKLGVKDAPAAADAGWTAEQKKFVDELAKDLLSKKGKSVVVAGDHLPAWVHALVGAINAHLGNIGQTVALIPSFELSVPPAQATDLKGLTEELTAKSVDVVLILGGANPAYSAPADFEFGKALGAFSKDRSKFTLHLGSHADETSVLCQWHVNESHYLETWGDIRGYDGTASIQQPLIAPLYSGRSAIEVLAALMKPAEATVPGTPHDPLEIVKATWHAWFTDKKKTGAFETFWSEVVRKGVIDGTAGVPEAATLSAAWAEGTPAPAPAPTPDTYELNFRPCTALFDGRFANNGWLQELPKPLTKIAWDNAAFMSPNTAKKFDMRTYFPWTGGEHGRAEVSVVELEVGGKKIKAPVWILPGHADGAVTVHLGHGRERIGGEGRIATAEGTYNLSVDGKQVRGFDAYPLRTSAAPWAVPAKITKTSHTYFLACTQGHWAMAEKDPISGKMLDRKPVRRGDLERFKAVPRFAKIPPMAAGETELINENVPLPKPAHGHETGHGDEGHDAHARLEPLNMYKPAEGLVPGLRDFQRRRWAMAIDLSACTGCSACVVACQSENNTPVVGKEQVTKGREMYWISIDRYYEGLDAKDGDPSAVTAYFQPRMCVQCENAPCEIVCPVGATVHSADGLNDMAYNRCVGTRYCSNNCPYKVRRFNFLTFQDWDTDTIKLGRNPDVSVRSRGVMEKCTFCVQRIRGAEIVAERELALGVRKQPDPAAGETLIKDGEILTACQAACPSGALVFGDINDPHAAVSRWKNEPQNYGLLAELNTRPRLTHMAVIRNPNPALK